ncbi:MAG TPA: hypothetical protein VI011_19155 [Asanoa sp.]
MDRSVATARADVVPWSIAVPRLRSTDDDRTAVRLGVYQQVRENYRAIDDLRLLLLECLRHGAHAGRRRSRLDAAEDAELAARPD